MAAHLIIQRNIGRSFSNSSAFVFPDRFPRRFYQPVLCFLTFGGLLRYYLSLLRFPIQPNQCPCRFSLETGFLKITPTITERLEWYYI